MDLPRAGPAPGREPSDDSLGKEPYGDVVDACDGCGATGIPLEAVEVRSRGGARFEMLLCPACRRRHRDRLRR